MNMFSLKNRKAIVTGGTRGLGRAMAEALSHAGAQVVIIGSSKGVFASASEMSQTGCQVQAIQADLGDRDAIAPVFESAINQLGGSLDILVNNAGLITRHKAEQYPLTDWDQVLALNLTTPFLLCQAAGRLMLGKGYGKIINVASLLSFFGGYTVPAYAASKAGLAQLTKAFANEWAGRGINVNAVAPGYMATDMTGDLVRDAARNREISARIPAGRWGTPEDLKGIVVFLASDASAYLNGTVIPVDGGYTGR